MDAKYVKHIEDVVIDLIKTYTNHLNMVGDDLEFYTVVTAMLVFKKLAMADVIEAIRAGSDEDPADIEALLEARATDIADSVRSRMESKSLN